MSTHVDHAREYLEADGLGGFASGTVGLARTRRYHGLLLAAATPPTGRAVLVAGFDAHVEQRPFRPGHNGRSRGGSNWPGRNDRSTVAAREAISSQSYDAGAFFPGGAARLVRFEAEPWPTWTFGLAGGAQITQELFATHGAPRVVVVWRARDGQGAPLAARLVVRPFLAGRDYHALCTREDAARLLAAPQRDGDALEFAMPRALPPVAMHANAEYAHAPHVYERFYYAEEDVRGFPHREDLAAPGELVFDLADGDACWVLSAGEASPASHKLSAANLAASLRETERARRAAFASPLDRAADAYVVRRGARETIVAGYPWFTDWGRDTFISLRGLCLATGRVHTAKRILLEWSGALADGVLPNRFVDSGEAPEYNAVDASLWFVVCAQELLAHPAAALSASERERLRGAVDAILTGYARGTKHRIHLDRDGLIAAGEAGVQLTWMDARIGGFVVTPRIGKPVEIQALWWNALAAAGEHDAKWRALAEKARASIEQRFWNEARGFLHDVVDVDHVAGSVDASLRPNQLFAFGGLPRALSSGERARRVVEVCERELWTPLGMRSLAPSEPGYTPRYQGGPEQRDRAYHQGTVWPWLVGPFVEAWLRVRGGSLAAKREARARFLAPLHAHLAEAGVGHVSEIADAEAPHTPRGCPSQAWSLAELLRLERVVLA